MLYPMDDHGVLDSTWGGHLADMVRFVQEMKIVRREQLLEQVADKTKHLLMRLHDLTAKFPKLMGNVRGLGLYQGFSLRKPEWKQALIRKALEDEQMLLLGAGPDTIRLRPSLSVTIEDIDLFSQKLERLLEGLE